MPTQKLSFSDLLNGGLTNPLVAQATLIRPDAVLDDKAVVSGFRKAGLQVERSREFSAWLGKLGALREPAELAAAMIGAKYQALGGAGGFLKQATTGVTVCPDGQGYFQHFQGGSIYWHYRTGAHEVHGLIRNKWAGLGWERSFLGYPTTDETTGRDVEGRGRFNHFQGGSIYWHPAVGTFEVHGLIRVKYLELGAEESFLGYPTTDESPTPDGIGRFNHFQAGSIYWTPYTGAHEVHGLIRQFWANQGWERNADLGYPLTDEVIPDRRIGFARPGGIRKPWLNVSTDLIRLPEAATTPGLTVPLTALPPPPPPPTAMPSLAAATLSSPAFSLATVNRRGVTASIGSTFSAASLTSVTGLSRPADAIRVRPDLLVDLGALLQAGISQGAKEGTASRNRYSDFENGVLFWARGSNTATRLRPWLQTAKGEKLQLTAAEVVAVAANPVRAAVSRIPSAQVANVAFVGTTRYLHDGAGVHNRRHKLQVTAQGLNVGGPIPTPFSASLEVQVEVSFDTLSGRIVGQLTEWRLLSTSGDPHVGSMSRQLHSQLDPLLWTVFPLLTIPSQDNAALPVLSVKTMPDGSVDVYIEP